MDTNKLYCILYLIIFVSIVIIFNIHLQFFFFNIQYFFLDLFIMRMTNNTSLKYIYLQVSVRRSKYDSNKDLEKLKC